jgi:hypothetical protein
LTIQQEGRVLGTANYCAPEQAIDSHRVDSRVDLYSLGCTLYFLLSGRPPFHTGSLAQRLLAHQSQEPSRIESLRSDVPPELGALLRRMMAKTPAARIATAGEVVEQLDRIIARMAGPAVRPAAVAASQPGFPELRDAIAKVASVERAVAMLACGEIGPSMNESTPRPQKPWTAAEIGARRRRQRQQQGRGFAGGLVACFAALALSMAVPPPRNATASSPANLMATISRKLPTGVSPSARSAAVANPAIRPVPEPHDPFAPIPRRDRQRTVVADHADIRRSG